MLNSVRIQDAYIKLYTQLRNYIWDFRTVQDIADLEIASFCKFPDIACVRNYLDKLYIIVTQNITKDEDTDIYESFDNFYSVINTDGSIYANILVV